MYKHMPDELLYIRDFKGAPLSVLMVLAVTDCYLSLPQLVDMTGYEADEVLPAIEYLHESMFIELDSITNCWRLSKLYALILFNDEQYQRRN